MSLRKTIAHFAKRVHNARAAFHSSEVGYELAIGRFSSFQIAYRERTADESVLLHSFNDDIFFTGVPEYQPKAGDLIIDIGAHIGTFSILAASHGCIVHAIEPCKETFNYLQINIALNPTLEILPHRFAISDFDGQVLLQHDRENWGHSIMKRLSPGSENVQAATLGTFIKANDIREVALIKLNCEGAEFPILMTTPIDILLSVRKMLVLYHLDLVEGFTLDGLLDRLHEVGFQTKVRNQTKWRGWIIAVRDAP